MPSPLTQVRMAGGGLFRKAGKLAADALAEKAVDISRRAAMGLGPKEFTPPVDLPAALSGGVAPVPPTPGAAPSMSPLEFAAQKILNQEVSRRDVLKRIGSALANQAVPSPLKAASKELANSNVRALTPGYKSLDNIVKDQMWTSLMEGTDLPEGAANLGQFWLNLDSLLGRSPLSAEELSKTRAAAERLTGLGSRRAVPKSAQKDITTVSDALDKHAEQLTTRDYYEAAPSNPDHPLWSSFQDRNQVKSWLSDLPEQYDEPHITSEDVERMLGEVFKNAK